MKKINPLIIILLFLFSSVPLYATHDGGSFGQFIGFNSLDFSLVEHYYIQFDDIDPSIYSWYSEYGVYHIDFIKQNEDIYSGFTENGFIKAFVNPLKFFKNITDPDEIIYIEYHINKSNRIHLWLIQYEHQGPIGKLYSYQVIQKELTKSEYQSFQTPCLMVRYGNKKSRKLPYDAWNRIFKPFLPENYTVLKGARTIEDQKYDEIRFNKKNKPLALSLKSKLKKLISSKGKKAYDIKLKETDKCNCGLSLITSKPYKFYMKNSQIEGYL